MRYAAHVLLGFGIGRNAKTVLLDSAFAGVVGRQRQVGAAEPVEQAAEEPGGAVDVSVVLNWSQELARLTGLHEGMHVLDVGSGLGGPARTLAAEFGCRVTGRDLTEEFCRAAVMLTVRVGLQDRITFQHGSALDLPFEEATFDVVWTQGVFMNIADKPRELGEEKFYNVDVIGEVVKGDRLIDNFKYRFDIPTTEVGAEKIPLTVRRYLYPGDYNLILKVSDGNQSAEGRITDKLKVPEQADPPSPTRRTAGRSCRRSPSKTSASTGRPRKAACTRSTASAPSASSAVPPATTSSDARST